MRTWIVILFIAALLPAFAADDRKEYSPEKENPIARLGWLKGPATGQLGKRAEVRFPAGYQFLGPKDAEKFLKLTQNSTDGEQLGVLLNKEEDWWVLFEFEDIGYVKDDDKNDLKADELLESYKKGAEAENRSRRGDGVPPIQIVGWHVAPNYNDETKNLEWSVEAEQGGENFVNYNVRLLGRKGVVKVVLIDDRKNVDASLTKFRELLKSFKYTSGESYAEYRQGDKIAKYGLGALVLGGTAAAAAKFGLFTPIIALFKKAWKLVIVGVVAVGAWIKKLFTGRTTQAPPPLA
jgi:uncharacterized membrane-anchored protein